MKIVQFKNGKYGIQKGNKLYRVLTGILGINRFYSLNVRDFTYYKSEDVANLCQTKFIIEAESGYKRIQEYIKKLNPILIEKEIEYKNQD